MCTEQTAATLDALNEETRNIWNTNAEFWDARFGEGNDFQNLLIGPATERLLDLQPGELVLGAACGNGAFSRRMAQLGAHVVAFDFSERFLACARERTAQHIDRIEYKLIDATDEDQLLVLGRGCFDAAVCTMALMDMAAIDPLMSALGQLLRPGGRFVFSVLHPCFNSSEGLRKVITEEDRAGSIETVYAVQVSTYAEACTIKGVGMIGQPVAQYYFHRPMHLLFGACFEAGFVLDGLEEPAFGPEAVGNRALSWQCFKPIPPVLVARMRLPVA